MTAPEGYNRGSIITPEAVVLDFELAGVPSRAIAYAIDLIVQFIALFILTMLSGLLAVGSELAAIIAILVSLIMVVIGYPALMETFSGGRTLGRMVVGTRVVTVEGAPVRFRQAFIRALLGIVDNLATAGGIAVTSALVTRRGQRLGDLVAGTMVIRNSKPIGPQGALYFWAPTYLTAWSQTVDTNALGHDAYQMVRDFLTRPDMHDSAKQVVAEDLAALVSERLPHAARPATVPAMDYLTAIAAATQDPAAVPPPPPTAARPTGAPVPPPPGARPAAARYPSSRPVPPPPGARPAPPVPLVPQQPAFTQPVVPPTFPVQPGVPAQPAPAAVEPPVPPAPNDGGFSTPG